MDEDEEYQEALGNLNDTLNGANLSPNHIKALMAVFSAMMGEDVPLPGNDRDILHPTHEHQEPFNDLLDYVLVAVLNKHRGGTLSEREALQFQHKIVTESKSLFRTGIFSWINVYELTPSLEATVIVGPKSPPSRTPLHEILDYVVDDFYRRKRREPPFNLMRRNRAREARETLRAQALDLDDLSRIISDLHVFIRKGIARPSADDGS